MIDFMYNTHGHLLQDFNQTWLSPQQLEQYAAAIIDKGSRVEHCWGFIDGTVRPVCRPGSNQCVLYNRHKQVHAMKFQSIAATNSMTANLYSPVEGNPLYVYGDPAYPLSSITRTFQRELKRPTEKL